MKSHIKFIVLLLLTTCLGRLDAASFETPMMKSKWHAKTTKMRCLLTHRIPGYGSAGFMLDAGEPLKFYLRSEHSHHGIVSASLSDRASAWMHGEESYNHYQVDLESDATASGSPRLVVNGDIAERMFEALEIGRVPTFVYTKSASISDYRETNVAVSSVNFYKTYQEFKNCRAQVLPFGIKSVQDKILYFDYHSKKIDFQYEGLFKHIKRYFKAAGRGDVIITSEIPEAEQKFNKKWFNARFAEVQSRLVRAGVKKGKIKKSHALTARAMGISNPIRIRLFGPESLRTYYYRYKSSSLNREKKHRLSQLARYLKEYQRNSKVVIHSHTNSMGSRKSNKMLSAKWGREIKDHLIKEGVLGEDIVIKSYGESKPVFGNRSREGLRINQRVVLELTT